MTDLVIHWSADPVIFHIGSFGLRWYSLLFAVGFISAYFILLRMFRHEQVNPSYLDKLTIYSFVALLVGLRFGHCIFYEWSYYKNHLLEIVIPFNLETGEFTGYQGLASHGGAIGILLGLWLYCYKTKVNPVWILDRLVIVIPLVGAFVRCGNLMNSEIIGRPTDVPWAFIFERVDQLPRHPGQLYEALCYALFFAVHWYFYRRQPQKVGTGFFFGLCLFLIFTARIFIEYTKE
ncbi:MAG: prolipoprotein diacylglyceryl transferase, partial [Bacteroidales bacterium]|nr:prolipoprotein diacylglyceryl transferase [Bacteroidales bacterium]